MESYEEDEDYEYFEGEDDDEEDWVEAQDIHYLDSDFPDEHDQILDLDEVIGEHFRENALTLLDRRLHVIHDLILRTMQRSQAEQEKSLYPQEVRSKEVRVSAKGDYMK